MLFVSRNGRQVVLAIILVTVLYFAINIYAPYQREQRIAEELESLGAIVQWQSQTCFSPRGIRDLTPVCDRVCGIYNLKKRIPSDVLSELSSLRHLESLQLGDSRATDEELAQIIVQLNRIESMWELDLSDTSLTDAGLLHLRGSMHLLTLRLARTKISDAAIDVLSGHTDLRELSLGKTRVSDIGLESLRPLSNLKFLDLDDTQTTPEGRANLRQALPGCKITPDP